MAWPSEEASEHKGEAALGIVAAVLFLLLIATCARADRREEDLLGRLCARGDESACLELESNAEADAEAGRDGPY